MPERRQQSSILIDQQVGSRVRMRRLMLNSVRPTWLMALA
jgi:hypothetical protein